MQRCTAISTARVAAPSRRSTPPGARVSLRLTGRWVAANSHAESDMIAEFSLSNEAKQLT
eukprot:1767954-Pleurochrysis_carterae.AAC.1